ncbi:uncharacterized protein LOC135377293 [Ornithodoros turicata]|uniref:uncharacterized protein LOC135377293 n=1 Tax=Ornithodoros turicata TaxID=34597 RepID=UPI0031390C6D
MRDFGNAGCSSRAVPSDRCTSTTPHRADTLVGSTFGGSVVPQTVTDAGRNACFASSTSEIRPSNSSFADSAEVDNVVPCSSGCDELAGSRASPVPITAAVTPSRSSSFDTGNVHQTQSQRTSSVNGRRIVEIDHFFSSLQSLSVHSPFGCGLADMEIVSEHRRGLCSSFSLKCRMCLRKDVVTTEAPVDQLVQQRMDVNSSAVNGIVSIGSGFSGLRELLGALDIPGMAGSTYSKYQDIVAKGIDETAWEEIRKAGIEEARLAREAGDVDADGFPIITVVADGAWCKRSYKNKYDALSGLAVIVGYRTKKVLFLGVRNKFCTLCASSKAGSSPKKHLCFKNWDSSSTSMEKDIVVEGFRRSIELHGVKYVQLIADGDSSTYKSILEAAPYQHQVVQKVECRNHLLRNYVSRLRDVALAKRTTPIPPSLKKLLLDNAVRLRVGVARAIHYRKEQAEFSKQDQIRNLVADIRNGPLHVFGDHAKCAGYFCSGPKEGEVNHVPELRKCGLFNEILVAMSRLANNGSSLILDVNNNAAEHFNSLVAKFSGGKRINFSQRGSFGMRASGAVVSFNSKQYHRALHKAVYNTSPGKYAKIMLKRKAAVRAACIRHRSSGAARCKRSLEGAPCKRASSDNHYGSIVDAPDMNHDDYVEAAAAYKDSLVLSQPDAEQLEADTRGQEGRTLWMQERRKRLTASNFGKVCKMRDATSSASTVRSLLYGHFDTEALRYGRDTEPIAIAKLQDELGVTVSPCGLVVDQEFAYLAATPDGLVGDDTVVEVKCPYSARPLTPVEGVRAKKITFCTIDNSGNISLKENHDYHYQVQGQLHITRRQFCLFVVYSGEEIFVQKIERNDGFCSKMIGHLQLFYSHSLLPELVDPRQSRGLQLRDNKKSDHQVASLCDAAKTTSNQGDSSRKRRKTGKDNSPAAVL